MCGNTPYLLPSLSLPPPPSLCPSLLISRFLSLYVFRSRVGGVDGTSDDEIESVTARLGAFSCFRGEEGEFGDGAVSLSFYPSLLLSLSTALSSSLSAMPRMDRRVDCRTGVCAFGRLPTFGPSCRPRFHACACPCMLLLSCYPGFHASVCPRKFACSYPLASRARGRLRVQREEPRRDSTVSN